MAAVNGVNGCTDSSGVNGMNGDSHSNGEYDAPFTIRDTPVENLRPLKVVVVGAGFSGILAAIRFPERLRNVELVVYEKNEGVGGVWWLNKYPGVACDIPSHSYQYSFAPNPNWSNLYAPGSEIQQYLQDVAERYGATRFIKTSHRVEHCEWDDRQKKWKIKVTNLASGETFEDTSNFLITARGQLNDISWPDIPGLDKFEGKMMHSGEWDTEYDFRNKRIGIIGNGSSAIQIIPKLQKVAGASLTCFMRSPTWISSAFGDEGMMELGLDPSDTAFSAEQRHKLATDPAYLFKLRKVFENGGNLIHDSTIRGTTMQKSFQSSFHQAMHAKLASRPDLLALLIPSFAPGCRRLTPGKGFLESLLEPNVKVVSSPIARIEPTGVVTATTTTTTTATSSAMAATTTPTTTTTATTALHEIDVLVCATGYHVSSPPPFPILGRHGLPLTRRWHARAESYLSLAVDGFPNLLMMFGPNSAIGFGSLTRILEAEAEYAARVVRKCQREDYAAAEPRADRVRDFVAYVDAYFADTVYMDDCRSWYKGRGHGKIVGLWPGSTLHALEALRAPRWEDWEFESVEDQQEEEEEEGKEEAEEAEGKKKEKTMRRRRRRRKNALAWLGNGRSVTQVDGDPSWYINPEEVEVPLEGRPEENARFTARPWCH